jgi:uncharacterized protein (TIGR02147 family)
MNELEKISIFSYLDYRKYLKDYYLHKKQTRRGFSLRAFSKRANLGSSNLLKRVIDGERNLTENTITKFAHALDLNKQETDFFRNLVHFCQSKTHQQKDYYYSQLIQHKKYHQVKPLEKEQYEFCSAWYHGIIRELIVSEHYGSIEKISEKINPKISNKQIESSVQLLEKIGLIKKSPEGGWISSDAVITTGSECESVIVMNYHKNLLNMTKDRLEEVPSDQRYVNSLVLGVDKETIPILRKKIQDFCQDILKLVSDQEDASEVLVLTNQLMPYTKTWSNEKP